MLCCLSGPELTILSAVIASQIACCVPEEQLELYAALYSAIGDQIALILTAGCGKGEDTAGKGMSVSARSRLLFLRGGPAPIHREEI